MKVTKEMIYDREHTVVWKGDRSFDLENIVCGTLTTPCGIVVYTPRTYGEHDHLATALPPLPKHPKPEHVRLFNLYHEHGIALNGSISGSCKHTGTFVFVAIESAYIIDTGEQVEVAIYDNTAQKEE